MHHIVPNILNFTSSLLMLLFVQPLSGNSLTARCFTINNHTDFWSKFCILYWMVPCWQAVWGVTFKICVLFRCPVWKTEKFVKSKPTRKLRHANSILEYFEYFCQMSSKSIPIILSYTVSKLARFFWDTVYTPKYDTVIIMHCKSLHYARQMKQWDLFYLEISGGWAIPSPE